MRGMVYIASGLAPIGAPDRHLDRIATDQQHNRTWFEDETPQHEVNVDDFYLDRAPVTNSQYAGFAAATGYRTRPERRGFGLVYGRTYWEKAVGVSWRTPGPGIDAVTERPDHPVVHVDLADALAYAEWIGKRLPTEQEWEYAAHGRRWMPWPWGYRWDPERANSAEYWAGPLHDLGGWRRWWEHRYALDGPAPATTAVGKFSPAGDSPWGVADMAGNVAEWTASTYHPYCPTRPYDEAFETAMNMRFHVIRGGGWKHFRYQTRTSERIACTKDYSAFDLGFRCAADIPTNKEVI